MATPGSNIYKSSNKYSPGFTYNRRYHRNPAIIETKEKISCDHAQEDGWHDHADLFSGGKIKILEELIAGQAQYVPCTGPRPHTSEPLYLSSKLTNEGHDSYCKPTPQIEEHQTSTRPSDRIWIMDDARIQQHYSPLVSDKYKVAHISLNDSDGARNAAGLDMPDTTVSIIQECLYQIGINETIYILRDVAYANWRDDIGKWRIKDGKQTQVITLVTGTCIYDPGPTLTCYTDSAREQGFATSSSRSRYAIFYPTPEETILEFPAFPDTDQPIISPEQLIYSRFPSTLHSTIDKTVIETLDSPVPRLDFNRAHEALQKVQATLYIQEDMDQGKRSVFIVNKNNSSITKKISELPLKEVLNYIGCMGKKLPVGAPFDEGFFTSIVGAGGVKKVLSKKFGDGGIALSTLHSSIPYILFEPTENALSSGGGYFTLSRGNSNDIHAFLSYDAIAVAAAIEYGCPIVIHNTHKGFVIYVSRILQETFSTPYAIAFSKHQGIGCSISSLENSKTKFDDIRRTLPQSSQRITNITSFIENLFTSMSGSIINSDFSYHLFLSIYYLFSPITQLLMSIKVTPDPNISEEVVGSINTIIASLKAVYNTDDAIFNSATEEQKQQNVEDPFIQSLEQTRNAVAIEEGIQRVKDICDPFLLFKQQFDTIENVFLSILTKIDIKFELSGEGGLVAQYFSGVDYSSRITQYLNSTKIVDIVCAPAGGPLIENAFPFRDTQNSSCFRKFFRTIGVGQKLPYFDTPTLKCIAERISENDVILPLFREKLSSIFAEINSKCDPAMSRLLSQSFSQMNAEQIGTPLEGIVMPALLVGGSITRKKTIKSIGMNKTLNLNNPKMFGSTGFDVYMNFIGEAFVLLYMKYTYDILFQSLQGLRNPDQRMSLSNEAILNIQTYLLNSFSILFGYTGNNQIEYMTHIEKMANILLAPTTRNLIPLYNSQLSHLNGKIFDDYDENGYKFYLEYVLGADTTPWGKKNSDLFFQKNEEMKKIMETVHTMVYDPTELPNDQLYTSTSTIIPFGNFSQEDVEQLKDEMDRFFFGDEQLAWIDDFIRRFTTNGSDKNVYFDDFYSRYSHMKITPTYSSMEYYSNLYFDTYKQPKKLQTQKISVKKSQTSTPLFLSLPSNITKKSIPSNKPRYLIINGEKSIQKKAVEKFKKNMRVPGFAQSKVPGYGYGGSIKGKTKKIYQQTKKHNIHHRNNVRSNRKYASKMKNQIRKTKKVNHPPKN